MTRQYMGHSPEIKLKQAEAILETKPRNHHFPVDHEYFSHMLTLINL